MWKRMNVVSVFVVLIVLTMLCGCSSPKETVDDKKVTQPAAADTLDPAIQRHTLKSTLTDWTAEYAITYADAQYVNNWQGHYSVAKVEILNTGNNPIWLYDFLLDGYTLQDNTGNQKTAMFESCFPYVVYPGEKGFLFGSTSWNNGAELTIALNMEPFADTCLTMEEALLYDEKYALSDLNIDIDENECVHIAGKVTNNFAEDDEGLVAITGAVLDKNGRLLCVVLGGVDTLAAGETKEFTAVAYTCGTVNLADIDEYTVEAYR